MLSPKTLKKMGAELGEKGLLTSYVFEYSSHGNSKAVPQNIDQRMTIPRNEPTSVDIVNNIESRDLEGYLHNHVYNSFVHNNQR